MMMEALESDFCFSAVIPPFELYNVSFLDYCYRKGHIIRAIPPKYEKNHEGLVAQVCCIVEIHCVALYKLCFF